MADTAHAKAILDDLVSEGAALDVYEADQARRLLEELDRFVEPINQSGTGKHFAANLQGILQRELVLALSRLYEPYSDRHPGRSLRALIRHIRTHAAMLRVGHRESVINLLSVRGEPRAATGVLSDVDLSIRLSDLLDAQLPRPDATSGRPLDAALALLKTVRDKRIAHRDQVSRSVLLIPGWDHLIELIDEARTIVEMVAGAYVVAGYNLTSDAKAAARSLRRLLRSAGLSDSPNPENPGSA